MSDDEKTKAKGTISYIGYLVKDVNLPSDLSEFKTQFKKDFNLEKLIDKDDEIKLYYNKNNEKTDIEKDEDYQNMLDDFAQDNKEKIVYVETEKLPVHFEGGKSIDFEDEIQKVVERELRIAANNIKKCLTTNLSLSNSKKVREEMCKECNKQIIGYLYKEVTPEEDNFYCELCSTKVDKPMFKIN